MSFEEREYVDNFSLLCETDKEAKLVEKKIKTALRRCANRIHEISELHPGAGIGGTATDESICSVLYNMLCTR